MLPTVQRSGIWAVLREFFWPSWHWVRSICATQLVKGMVCRSPRLLYSYVWHLRRDDWERSGIRSLLTKVPTCGPSNMVVSGKSHFWYCGWLPPEKVCNDNQAEDVWPFLTQPCKLQSNYKQVWSPPILKGGGMRFHLLIGLCQSQTVRDKLGGPSFRNTMCSKCQD